MNRPELVGTKHEGNDWQDPFIRLWHALSKIQLSEWSETPKNEMKKEF